MQPRVQERINYSGRLDELPIDTVIVNSDGNGNLSYFRRIRGGGGGGGHSHSMWQACSDDGTLITRPDTMTVHPSPRIFLPVIVEQLPDEQVAAATDAIRRELELCDAQPGPHSVTIPEIAAQVAARLRADGLLA